MVLNDENSNNELLTLFTGCMKIFNEVRTDDGASESPLRWPAISESYRTRKGPVRI